MARKKKILQYLPQYFFRNMLRGTNLTIIYASTYDIYEVRNCCRGSRQAGSPVPGEILPGRRSGQRKLPQSGCKWALFPAGGADLQIPRKKYLGNWEEPQQIKELTVPQPPALFIWVSWRGQGLAWRFSLAPSPPSLCSLFYPPSVRALIFLYQ